MLSGASVVEGRRTFVSTFLKADPSKPAPPLIKPKKRIPPNGSGKTGFDYVPFQNMSEDGKNLFQNLSRDAKPGRNVGLDVISDTTTISYSNVSISDGAALPNLSFTSETNRNISQNMSSETNTSDASPFISSKFRGEQHGNVATAGETQSQTASFTTWSAAYMSQVASMETEQNSHISNHETRSNIDRKLTTAATGKSSETQKQDTQETEERQDLWLTNQPSILVSKI